MTIPDEKTDKTICFKDEATKATRFFVICYDVSPDFASSFKFEINDGAGERRVKYMEVAFVREHHRGEFFIEFDSAITDDNLVKCFHARGARGISVDTFANDKGVSAANSLVYIMGLQEQTGLKVTRGVCSETLLKLVKKKQAEDEELRQKQLMAKELNEKTEAAIQMSLRDLKQDVQMHGSKLDIIENGMHSHVVKLEGIESGMQKLGGIEQDMQSQAVKLEGIESGMQKLDGIEHGVCSVIPDYQNENMRLKQELAHQITQRNSQEGKTASQTRRVNELERLLAIKEQENAALHNREKVHFARESAWNRRILELESMVDISKIVENLQQMKQLVQEERAYVKEEHAFARSERATFKDVIAEAHATADTLASLVSNEEERAAKRQRA